ncbi:uroporphyrinogen-III C-methyltransferase, partial [Vibrio cholerae]
IYMGLMKSSTIATQLIEHGRNASTPIAIIERGTQSTQKVFRGVLSELPQLAAHAQSPSLIVIGEVVTLADKLACFGDNTKPSAQYQYA